MAGSLSDYAEHKILAHSLAKTTWTVPSTLYIALYSVAPNENTKGTELTTGQTTNYQRLAVTGASWSEPTSGSISNAVRFEFGPAGTSWGTIEGIAILDAITSGNEIWYGTFSSPRTIVASEKLVFDPGSFILTLS